MNGKFKDFLSLSTVGLTIIGLSFFLMIFFLPLYIFLVFHLDIPSKVHLSSFEVIKEYCHVLIYLTCPFISLKLKHFTLSVNALQHFSEVKCYFIGLEILFIFIFYFGIKTFKRYIHLGYLYTLEMKFKRWRWYPLGLVIFFPLGFNHLFILLHHLLFRNNYWIFDPSIDPIIYLFPISLFLLTGIGIVIIYEILLALLLQWIIRKEKEFEECQ